MKSFPGVEHLKSEHELLRGQLEKLCRDRGLDFSYEHVADKELYFSRTILDCTWQDRQLYVNLTEQNEAPSAYIKEVGLHDENKRLVLNVEKVEGLINLLWHAYLKWLIDRADESEMEKFIKDNFD